MTKYTIAFLSLIGVFGTSTTYANVAASNGNNEETFFSTEVKNNPVKKKGTETIVLSESKANDDAMMADFNALMEEMSLSKSIENEITGSTFLTEQVISNAFDYRGVRYRFGGSSRSGIDCSGLVKTAFNDTDISLPRNSAEMAQVGERVGKTDAQRGDLIFFRTGRGARISHVGIVTEVLNDEIKFIHSSTTKGVIISSTKEDYYKNRFVQINRVMEELNTI